MKQHIVWILTFLMLIGLLVFPLSSLAEEGKWTKKADMPSVVSVDIQKHHGFAEVNGTRLYYEIFGSGSPLVLIHGFSLDHRMWDDQFDTFAQHYRLIRYDVRGFGKSALPTGESYTHADDLKSLLDHLGITKAYVLGLSMGGGIAVNFALDYPESTGALILVDSTLGGFQWSPETSAQFDLIRERAKNAGIQAAKELWLEHPLFKPAREKPDLASRLEHMVADYSGWHFVNDGPPPPPKRAAEPPAIKRLDQIRVPTLIIVGEQDLPDFHKIADILHQHIRDSRKVVLRGVGHMANMERPDRFNEIILDFLSRVSSIK